MAITCQYQTAKGDTLPAAYCKIAFITGNARKIIFRVYIYPDEETRVANPQAVREAAQLKVDTPLDGEMWAGLYDLLKQDKRFSVNAQDRLEPLPEPVPIEPAPIVEQPAEGTEAKEG